MLSTTLGISALVASEPLTKYIESLESMDLGTPLLMGAKALLAFPIAYHTCNGVRHLLWDTGNFLTIKEVYITGYLMLLLAISATAGLLTL